MSNTKKIQVNGLINHGVKADSATLTVRHILEMTEFCDNVDSIELVDIILDFDEQDEIARKAKTIAFNLVYESLVLNIEHVEVQYV